MMTDTIFQKIIDKEMQADIVYEDDLCLAFNDINPQAPVHILIIPKQSIVKLSDSTEKDVNILGHLMTKAAEIARSKGLEENFRLVVNNGAGACQTVFHLHLHILGGRDFTWPPG